MGAAGEGVIREVTGMLRRMKGTARPWPLAGAGVVLNGGTDPPLGVDQAQTRVTAWLCPASVVEVRLTDWSFCSFMKSADETVTLCGCPELPWMS
jgi:hypothetical protein